MPLLVLVLMAGGARYSVAPRALESVEVGNVRREREVGETAGQWWRDYRARRGRKRSGSVAQSRVVWGPFCRSRTRPPWAQAPAPSLRRAAWPRCEAAAEL